MRHLPTAPPELEGLPDWPLLLTERAAASYLSLSPADFERGQSRGELPKPRRTPGGPRWARRDLDTWYETEGPPARTEHDALSAAVEAAWRRS